MLKTTPKVFTTFGFELFGTYHETSTNVYESVSGIGIGKYFQKAQYFMLTVELGLKDIPEVAIYQWNRKAADNQQ
jgi:hypothetical protein